MIKRSLCDEWIDVCSGSGIFPSSVLSKFFTSKCAREIEVIHIKNSTIVVAVAVAKLCVKTTSNMAMVDV